MQHGSKYWRTWKRQIIAGCRRRGRKKTGVVNGGEEGEIRQRKSKKTPSSGSRHQSDSKVGPSLFFSIKHVRNLMSGLGIMAHECDKKKREDSQRRRRGRRPLRFNESKSGFRSFVCSAWHSLSPPPLQSSTSRSIVCSPDQTDETSIEYLLAGAAPAGSTKSLFPLRM